MALFVAFDVEYAFFYLVVNISIVFGTTHDVKLTERSILDSVPDITTQLVPARWRWCDVTM